MMKYIITTTINLPTKAVYKFCEIAENKNFKLIIVGDLKTPHQEYIKLEKKHKNVRYLSPEEQDKLYPDISIFIGWNSIQRRNIGFLYAYQNGAEIIATIDDDNVPYDNWGDDILIGKEIYVDEYKNTSIEYFDSLSVTNHKEIWHRGFPIELLKYKNNIEYKGKIKIKPLVQANFWDGDPDIDAICRLTKKPIVKFDFFEPFTTKQLTPFNSQNTFIDVSVLKYYSVIPFIGRMDDIWGSYILQYHFPNSVIFSKASVYQERNSQNIIDNLENEVIGYRHTLDLLGNIENYVDILPEKSKKYLEIYQKYFK